LIAAVCCATALPFFATGVFMPWTSSSAIVAFAPLWSSPSVVFAAAARFGTLSFAFPAVVAFIALDVFVIAAVKTAVALPVVPFFHVASMDLPIRHRVAASF
jgi:hypothetical protein